MGKYTYRPVYSAGHENGRPKRTDWYYYDSRIVAWAIVSPQNLVIATVASRREARNIVSLLNPTSLSRQPVESIPHIGNIDQPLAS